MENDVSSNNRFGDGTGKQMDNLSRAVIAVLEAVIEQTREGMEAEESPEVVVFDVAHKQQRLLEIETAKMRYAWAKAEVQRGTATPGSRNI